MAAIKFLYFDLGNVLVTFDHRRAARQMAEAAGVSEQAVWQLVFESDLLARVERGETSDREFYEIFCQATGTRADYEELQLAGSAIFDLNLSIIPLVGHLAAANIPLGILSNTSASHWDYVASGRYGIVPGPFEQIVLSYQTGSIKPEPVIYRVAAEQCGRSPEEIFFVDDRRDNVDGALKAGFDAVQFTSVDALARELRSRGLRCNF